MTTNLQGPLIASDEKCIFDEEKNWKALWQEPEQVMQIVNTKYEFPDLASWLNNLNLSRIYNVLKEQKFETLDTLVQLNLNDLDELCETIRTNLKTANVEFTLFDKGLFKSEIMREKEKYDDYMLTKQLDHRIKIYEDVMNWSTKAINDCTLHQQLAMQSISEISSQIQMVMSNLCEIAFEKYLKANYSVQKHVNRSLLKLKEAKQKCEKTETYDAIEDAMNETTDDTGKFMNEGDMFLGDELMPAMIQSFLTDVNIAKICQQLVSFGLVPIRHVMRCVRTMENVDTETDVSLNDTSTLYLMMLPHAIGYVDDIKIALNNHNVKIIKECGSISSEKTALLLMTQFAGFIDKNIHELAKEEKLGYKKPENDDNNKEEEEDKKDNDVEDKQKDNDDNKEELDEFEVDPVHISDAGYITLSVHYHLDKYFEEVGNAKALIYTIEMQQHSDDFSIEYFSNNFDVYCPAVIGEYASIYHPTSINGKFMNIYRETMDEKRFNSKVHLGFIQVIQSEIWEEVFEEAD